MRFSLRLVSVFSAAAAVGLACGDPADELGTGRRGSATGGEPGAGGEVGTETVIPKEERLYREAEAELVQRCAGQCHGDGTYRPVPPTFLAGPDTYKSIKAQPGIVTRDVYQSSVVTKGQHDGPALATNAEFERKVMAWLEAESLAIKAQKLPTTEPFTVKVGPNDVDLSPVASGGLAGVRLKFEAAMLGSILQLSKIAIVAPAGSDVHLQAPKFFRVPAVVEKGKLAEFVDPADSFSNLDLTVQQGKETEIPPGSVIFSGAGWVPYDLAGDKLRIEVTKLEKGTYQVAEGPKTCANVQTFQNNVLNQFRGGASLNCQNCHNQNGNNGGFRVDGNDVAFVCQQVLIRLNEGNLAQSLVITKPTGNGAHTGGKVQDQQGWMNAITNNRAAFFAAP